MSLREALHDLVLHPLGISSQAGYGPCLEAPSTEYDSWRGRRIRGEVHDENAAVLGGVAGHAGFFATADAVAGLACAYLQPHRELLAHDVARSAVRQHVASVDERRGLGFALRSPDPGASERPFSPAAFGHYGFTGTSIWSDPTVDVTVVLLTNRVYFGRDPWGIKAMRVAIHQIVADEVRSV
jgi:CubicO group peptidase (beta-lactamase class C family)